MANFTGNTADFPDVIVPCAICGRPVTTVAGALDSICLNCCVDEDLTGLGLSTEDLAWRVEDLHEGRFLSHDEAMKIVDLES